VGNTPRLISFQLKVLKVIKQAFENGLKTRAFSSPKYLKLVGHEMGRRNNEVIEA